MKRILFIFCLFLFFIPLRAQFRFSMQGGLNVTTQVAKNYNLDNAKNTFLFGFNAGPAVDFRLGRHVTLYSSAILETKGTRGVVHQSGISADVINRLLYLDFPLLVRWNFKAGEMQIFFEAGLYAGLGLQGHARIETADTGKSWTIRWGTGTQDDFRRFDYGAMAGAGLEWKRFSFEGNFAYGIANIYALGQIGYDIEQRAFSLRLGYFLGRGPRN